MPMGTRIRWKTWFVGKPTCCRKPLPWKLVLASLGEGGGKEKLAEGRVNPVLIGESTNFVRGQ